MKLQKNTIAQLDSIFFSTLDALRGVWRTSNAINVLTAIFFYKRIVALSQEGEIDLNLPASALSWSDSFRNTVVDNPQKATLQLIETFMTVAKLNENLNNLFIPFTLALEQEQNSQHLIQVIVMLEEVDFSSTAISEVEFGIFFNDCLYKIAQQLGKRGGKHSTPKQLNQLLALLADPHPRQSVYDPCAGQGGSLIELAYQESEIFIYAQDQHINAWALAKMNLIVNSLYEAQLSPANSLTEDTFENIQMDIAVCHFPFGALLPTASIKNQSYLSIPIDIGNSKTLGNNLFLQRMLSKLNDKGKMVVILPSQALTNDKEDKKMREYLIRRDWIEGIITLPYGLLPSIGIPICVLIVNKNKSTNRREQIIFVNASNLPIKATARFNRELTAEQVKGLADAFVNITNGGLKPLKNCVAKVPLHQVILNDYILDAKSYASPFISKLQKLETQGHLIPLKEIFNTVLPTLWFDAQPSQDLPYVRVQNLGTSVSNYNLDITTIPNCSESDAIAGKLINESMLLVNRSGKKLLASFFEFKEQSILVNENIMTFRIDTTRTNIEYLILQLHENLFLQQLDMYKNDVQHKSISEQQFEELKINLPDLEQQATIVKQTKLELLLLEEQKVEQLRQDLNLGKQKAQSEQYKIISSLQHELGNKLPSVLMEFKNLRDYLQDKVDSKEIISFQEPISPLFEGEDKNDIDTLEQVTNRIETILKHAINTLDATSDIIKADRSKLNLAPTSIKAFLEEIKEIYSSDQQFEIIIEIEEDENGKEIPLQALLDKTQMTTAVCNLIENAKRHGFNNTGKKHLIIFEAGCSNKSQDLRLVFKNDGRSFPSNFSFEDFITYGNYAGDTGHSGIGGFLIAQIIENHNGTFTNRPITNPQDPFKVQFEITIPNQLQTH